MPSAAIPTEREAVHKDTQAHYMRIGLPVLLALNLAMRKVQGV